jgi:hypothetical protein
MAAPAAVRLAQIDVWLNMARAGRDLRGYRIRDAADVADYVDRLLEIRHDIQTEMETTTP